MKLLLLAPAGVIHTQRWVEALHGRGIRLVLATQHDQESWRAPVDVKVVRLPHCGTAGYFRNVPALKRLLRDEQPDLLSAHYASGYGTTAALAGFRPWLLSVWGSDVYDFPYEGRLQGWLLRRNLRQADAVASTSEAMAGQVRRLVPDIGPVAVTPFGIDTERFAPQPPSLPHTHDGIVIGTVKTLAPKYGIDLLLRAFAQVLAAAGPSAVLSLVIVGDGPQRTELEALSRTLGIAAKVRFVGAVPHAEVPQWLNRFDMYVAASRLDSESFGVAVLEASACGLPVVVSDVGGLPEVVVHGETGWVVPRGDVPALAQAIQRLIDAPEMGRRLGAAGRERVLAHYRWQHSVDAMLRCFEAVIARRAQRLAVSAGTPQ
jgi:glycosyltransferase involved in cell wall biosynthesis